MTEELYSTRGGCAMTTNLVDTSLEAIKKAVGDELKKALGTEDIPHIKLEIDNLVAKIDLMNERLDLVCSQNNQLTTALVPNETQGGRQRPPRHPYIVNP